VQPLAPDQCLAFFPGDERVADGGSNRWQSEPVGRSTPPSDRRPTPPSQRLTGRGCGLKWHGSSSSLSMAGSRWMLWSWRGRSRKTRGHEPRRLPGMV